MNLCRDIYLVCTLAFQSPLNKTAISRLCGLIVRVRVVLRRTAVGDTDRRFDNPGGIKSQVICESSVYGIYVSSAAISINKKNNFTTH